MGNPVGLHVDTAGSYNPMFWEWLLGYRSPVETKISAFLDRLPSLKVATPRGRFPKNWIVFAGIVACHNYLIRAHRHRQRFLKEAKSVRFHTTSPDTKDQSEEAKTQRYWQQARRTLDAQSEIEGVYFCLKLMLDRLATVFGFYFSIPLGDFGSSHKRLAKMIETGHPALASIRALLPESFWPTMKMLTDLIFEFRDKEIEHVNEPHRGVWPTLDWDDVTDPNCVPRLLSLGRDNEYEATRDPAFLIAQVEKYVIIALAFMAAHEDINQSSKSQLSHGTPARRGFRACHPSRGTH